MQTTLYEKYHNVAVNCLNEDYCIQKDLSLTQNIAKKLVDWFECRFPEKIEDGYVDAQYFCKNIARFVEGTWLYYWDQKSIRAGFTVGLLSYEDCKAYAKHHGLRNDFLASIVRQDVL